MESRSLPGVSTAWDATRVTLGRTFLRDMELLWSELLKMAAIVEAALNSSVQALCDVRLDLAAAVEKREPAVNSLDVEIEQHCLKVLALHQPVASDLRRVAAILKIDHDLERVADLADHISKRVRKQAKEGQTLPLPDGLEQMAVEAVIQVRDSLDALVKSDCDLARKVIISDRRIDRMRRDIVRRLKDQIRSNPDHLETLLRHIDTSRNLERVADHATNIAEAVIYMTDGVIVRHTVRPSKRSAQ